MELREFAENLLMASCFDDKLRRFVGEFSDGQPGQPLRLDEPNRPENLRFAPRRAAPSMPKPGALSDPLKRGVAHHIMANHELQAVEVMAMTLCRFPESPHEFRLGLARIIDDEQRHTRMHAERAESLGVPFGSLPVNCYIWKKAVQFTCVMDYLAGLPLVFENRNLDHSREFETYFRRVGDRRSAAIMRVIHRDEIRHVAFGLTWLRRLKPHDQSEWEAYCQHLHWPLRPEKAVGDTFQRDAREAAGMSPEFLEALERLAGD